jgi:hypothetical protein
MAWLQPEAPGPGPSRTFRLRCVSFLRPNSLSLLPLRPPVQNSVFAIFCQTFAVLGRTVCDLYPGRERELKDGRAGLAEMRDIDRSTSDHPRLCFDGV